MVINIDNDSASRVKNYHVAGIIYGMLALYAVLWTKLRMKAKLFRPVSIEQIMATENEIYQVIRQRERESRRPERKAGKAAR